MEKEWADKYDVPCLVQRKSEEISEPLAYACGSWAFHFTYADSTNGSAELKGFFKDIYYDGWIV